MIPCRGGHPVVTGETVERGSFAAFEPHCQLVPHGAKKPPSMIGKRVEIDASRSLHRAHCSHHHRYVDVKILIDEGGSAPQGLLVSIPEGRSGRANLR